MSRKEYDSRYYDSQGDRAGVDYALQHSSSRHGSASGPGYGPPGGYPESPNDSHPRTTYPAPISMPHAPLPPEDGYSNPSSQPSATIVSGRRPPSPGVRFADDYPSNSGPRGSPPRDVRDSQPRRSGGRDDWERVYQRELAEQRALAERNASRERDRGLDVSLDAGNVRGRFAIGRDRAKDKEKREHDLAWSSGDDSDDDKEKRRRERERADRERAERERQKDRERADRERADRERAERERADRERADRERADRENRRRSTHYGDSYYGDPRRSSGQIQDPRRSASALVDDPRRSSGQLHDPRRSSGALVISGDPRRSTGDLGDPRRSSGHLVRYQPPPLADEITGVRYVQRHRSPSGSERPPSTQYLLSEPSSGRRRASSVGQRHPSVTSINTDLNRMNLHGDRYGDYPPDAYRPSYYDLSPMPSPNMGPRDRGFNFDVGGNLSLGSSLGSANIGYSAQGSSGHSHHIRPHYERRPSEQHQQYDPSDHAQIMYKALKGKVADVGSIIKVLPLLSGDQVISLRKEYKKVHPLGNVNLAKHLKAQLSGKIQLAAYAVACGPFESETYWSILSNQKPNFRHALLIEALMGRENDDIIDIKESYRDSKYDNNFEKAIAKELAADKAVGERFKELVLLQLEARGMDEWDNVYIDKVRDDAEDLHDVLGKDKVDSLFVGKIVITRSTTHLREMMRLYKKLYDQDFARVVAQRISGLVGEALLHVLNGVLNKPARDARLLEESMKGVGTRDDLLVARLTRIHWDPDHMAAVKEAYKAKYNLSLRDRIIDECSGPYQEFLLNMILVDTHTTAVVKH